MRLFHLQRDKDSTGISGTGKIAEGVLFPSGKVVLQWLTGTPSVTVFDSMEDMVKVHGHGGNTKVIFRGKTKTAGIHSELLKMAETLPHVFVTGVPGAGKTTEAGKLSKKLGMPLVSLDGIGHGVVGTSAARSFVRKKLGRPHVIEGVQILGMSPKDVKGARVVYVDQPDGVVIDRLVRRGLRAGQGKLRKGESARGWITKRHTMMAAQGKQFRDRVAHETLTPPLEKLAYKLQGHTDVQGLRIAIENRKGSVRKGKDSDGHEWRTKMKAPYGYIVGTKGADDEPVDAYVGPDKKSPDAYVVHQHKDTGKGYDEDKVIIGVRSKKEAKELYLKHYDSPKFLGPISRVSMERLKQLVASKRKLVKISSARRKA